MENRITKKDMFATIAAAMADNAEVVAFCEKEIASLEKKAATAKAKAAEKRAAGDELQAQVLSVLTNEWQSIAEVTAALDNEEISTNKVSYRLNALVAAGSAEKTDSRVSGEDGKQRTVKVFKLAE